MKIYNSTVSEIIKLQDNINLIKIHSPGIAESAKPGQFCNIKVSDCNFPLLRRPFSISDVEGEYIYFMFNVAGEGTKLLSSKQNGETVNILGPLGNGFNFEGEFESAVIIAGGLGAAPFPFLTKKLKNKRIYSFIGGRSEKEIITHGLENCIISTDNGSVGFRGNVVESFKRYIDEIDLDNTVIFSCGPTPMLKAVQDLSLQYKINCQLSTECAMACGFGICQGCNIESAEEEDKYKLVCIDGPVFDAKEVKL